MFFCFQFVVVMAIIFTDDTMYPRNNYGAIIPYYRTFWEALSKIKVFVSLFTAALGMAKFILNGPISILPKDYPINGLVSPHFMAALLIHTMFGFRTICIENAFFTTYQQSSFNNTTRIYDRKRIDPILPTEYRMLVYFIPVFITMMIGTVQLVRTSKGFRGLNLAVYPQFLIGCGFSPIMYEGYEVEKRKNSETTYGFRIWKVGTIVNAVFLGCIPQLILLFTDYYKGVPSWAFSDKTLREQEDEQDYEGNDALFKNNLGNTLFSSITLVLFLILNLSFFYWVFYCLNYLDPSHTFIPSGSMQENPEEKNEKEKTRVTPQEVSTFCNLKL